MGEVNLSKHSPPDFKVYQQPKLWGKEESMQDDSIFICPKVIEVGAFSPGVGMVGMT